MVSQRGRGGVEGVDIQGNICTLLTQKT